MNAAANIEAQLHQALVAHHAADPTGETAYSPEILQIHRELTEAYASSSFKGWSLTALKALATTRPGDLRVDSHDGDGGDTVAFAHEALVCAAYAALYELSVADVLSYCQAHPLTSLPHGGLAL